MAGKGGGKDNKPGYGNKPRYRKPGNKLCSNYCRKPDYGNKPRYGNKKDIKLSKGQKSRIGKLNTT